MPLSWTSPIVDTELLPNGVLVLRCGTVRDAVRVPYLVGIRAYAYLRWMRAPIGDVLSEPDKHVYFMIRPGAGAGWSLPTLGLPEQLATPPRLLGHGSIIVLPTTGRRPVRWLREPGPHHFTDAADVFTALRHARRRLSKLPHARRPS
jgi:hypothetical protein